MCHRHHLSESRYQGSIELITTGMSAISISSSSANLSNTYMFRRVGELIFTLYGLGATSVNMCIPSSPLAVSTLLISSAGFDLTKKAVLVLIGAPGISVAT